MSDSLQWIRPPQQARSQATLERLLDAAETLLANKSWEDTAVSEIARRAESSVGAFYARFRDKDGLLQALQERFLVEAYATADDALDPERWEGASLAEIMAAVVEFLVRIHEERGPLLRALQLRAATHPDTNERSDLLTRHLEQGLQRLAQDRGDEISHPDPEKGVEFVLRIVLAVLMQRKLLGEDAHRHPLSGREITAELTRACLAHLGISQ